MSLYAEANEGDELLKMMHTVTKTASAATPQVAAGDAIRYAYKQACGKDGITVNPVACIMVCCGGMAMAVGEEGLEQNCTRDLGQLEGLPMHVTIGVTAFGEQDAGDHANLSVGMLVLTLSE